MENEADRNRRAGLKYAFEGELLSCAGASSDSSASSDGASSRLSGLAASLRAVSDALLRAERVEAELAKAREALRLQSETRRLESEVELTRLVAATELQIASLVPRRRPSRKRKRVGEDEAVPAKEQASQWEGSLVLSLLQYNLLF